MANPILIALISATLFGVSTPLAKLLVEAMPPMALASLVTASA